MSRGSRASAAQVTDAPLMDVIERGDSVPP
jgi:hypothetical protein